MKRITQPIAELIDAAQQVAQGKFGRTIIAQTGDEIEELAIQFNLMSEVTAQVPGTFVGDLRAEARSYAPLFAS